MLSDAAWAFSRIDSLWDAFAPRTPQGRRIKSARRFITDADELSAQYDLTEAAAAALRMPQTSIARLEHHLSRIPDLPDLAPTASLEADDVFLVKKFLTNWRAVTTVVDESVRDAFAMTFNQDALLSLLDAEQTGNETFHVSDRYDDELCHIRDALRSCDSELARSRQRLHEDLMTRYGLDFRLREFLVVPTNRMDAAADGLFVELHDSRTVIVRPVMPEADVRRAAERHALAVREKERTRVVLERLSKDILAAADALRRAGEQLAQFDVSLARARLWRQLGLTRARVSSEAGSLVIRNGRFLPLEERCRQQGLTYWPLSASFMKAASAVHGSNMCGKTAVLQTVAFLQLAAQLGLFVPAEAFETTAFDAVFVSDGSAVAGEEDLSSFGAEIIALGSALGAGGRRKLLLVDEFARATNSREALALISGLLEWLADQPCVRTVLATHYRPLPHRRGLAHYRMKGLCWNGFAQEARAGADLRCRVETLHRHVEYVIQNDDGTSQCDDALRVAEALGMDPRIVALARRHLEHGNTGLPADSPERSAP